VFKPMNVRKRYIRAAASLGFAYEPQAIWEAFLNLPTRVWPKAPIHGDMHAENVRVRGADAIIIDLAKVTMGPPGADPACLEVWIAFEAPPPGFEIERATCLRTAQDLFSYAHVVEASEADTGSATNWVRDAVLETRRIALMSSPRVEYAVTLALYLLRRAMFEPDTVDPTGDESRRAWAWVLGCRLLLAIQEAQCMYEEAA
jgi:aminoglycoside phosphotransferase (APT) family kinase protein